MQPPAVQGVGSYGGFQFMLQDQGKNTLGDLDRVAHQIVAGGRQSKDLTGMLTTFSANDPQVLVTIDREKAKAMSVPLSQITSTLGVFMGSQYINDFDFNNRTYGQGSAQLLCAFGYWPDDSAGQPGNRGRQLRSAGHFSLQPVPCGRDRRLTSAGLQLWAGARVDGGSG
jgi:hypothetical protein